MSSAALRLPGYEACCTVVGALYALLAGSMLARGAAVAMAPFGVPAAVLRSPHYADYFHFTFVHMVTLGVMIFLLGRYVEPGRPQRVVSRVLFLAQVHYAYLDLRTSDSPLGNHLYRGPSTLVPALVDVAVALCFLWLGLRPLRERAPLTSPAAAPPPA